MHLAVTKCTDPPGDAAVSPYTLQNLFYPFQASILNTKGNKMLQILQRPSLQFLLGRCLCRSIILVEGRLLLSILPPEPLKWQEFQLGSQLFTATKSAVTDWQSIGAGHSKFHTEDIRISQHNKPHMDKEEGLLYAIHKENSDLSTVKWALK